MPFDVEMLRQARPAKAIHYFPTIGSTMTEAGRLAECGAAHGTVVIANEQTAGIGRLGRSWTSAADVGVYCSVLLRLSLPAARFPVANLLLGLSVAEAIQNITNLVCDLRWPNDVLIHEKKVCGILTQLVGSCIVAGIGINVNQTDFDSPLRTPASSLLLESGCLQSREQLLLAMLESIDSFCSLLQLKGTDAILRAFSSASSYVTGRKIRVEDDGQEGVTAGLDDSGFLMLLKADGRMQRLSAGGVRAVT